MQKRLEGMPKSLSQKDMQRLSHGFERIDKSSTLTSAEQQRILSSVMRKAGIEMNDSERTRDNIKITRGFKGFGAAAAAAVALIVGLSAVSIAGRIGEEGSSLIQAGNASQTDDPSNALGIAEPFADKEMTDALLGTGSYEFIKEHRLYQTYTAEDECFKISFGNIVSDGTRAKLMMKTEGKTDEAREYLKDHTPSVYVFDPETREQARSVLTETDASLDRLNDGGVYYSAYWITTSFEGYSINKEMLFQLGIDRFADSGVYADDYDDEGIDESRANVKVDLSQNITAKEFVSEDGSGLTLSPYGLVSGEYTDELNVKAIAPGEGDTVIMTLEYTDGVKQDVTMGELGEAAYGYIAFERVRPDPELISAVEIGGGRYIQEVSAAADKKTVDRFFGDGYYDYIKRNGLDKTYEAEDDSFKLSISNMISDGKRAIMLVRATGKTPEAVAYLKNQPLVNLGIYYADTKANVHVYGGASGYEDKSFDGGYTATSLSTIELENIDTSRDVYLQIGEDGFESNYAYGNADAEVFDSSRASVKVNLSKNIKTRTLTCGSKSLLLSDIAVTCEEYSTEEARSKFNDKLVNDPAVILTLEFADGTSKDITNSDVLAIFDDYKTVYFSDILDNCDTVSAVVINVSRYTAQ